MFQEVNQINKPRNHLLSFTNTKRSKILLLNSTIQLGVMLLVSSIAYWLYGSTGALSALIGGIIAVLANACFLFLCFSCVSARFGKLIVRRTFIGEIFKILLVALCFTLVFIFFVHILHVLTLFLSFILVYTSQILLLPAINKS